MVLQGAIETLKTKKPKLIIEVQNARTITKLEHALKCRNYKVVKSTLSSMHSIMNDHISFEHALY